MKISSSLFVKSSSKLSQCPPEKLPEFAFIGRSNVGKSSLINVIAADSKLAKISSTPGKTRTINHFIINGEWYLVDLPGYGYAKTSIKEREAWKKETEKYILSRASLICLFVLLDLRIKPQRSDIAFMEMLGINQVPIARVFTKADKLKSNDIEQSLKDYNDLMLENWEELPLTFITSSKSKRGREELLDFIEQSVNNYRKGL